MVFGGNWILVFACVRRTCWSFRENHQRLYNSYAWSEFAHVWTGFRLWTLTMLYCCSFTPLDRPPFKGCSLKLNQIPVDGNHDVDAPKRRVVFLIVIYRHIFARYWRRLKMLQTNEQWVSFYIVNNFRNKCNKQNATNKIVSFQYAIISIILVPTITSSPAAPTLYCWLAQAIAVVGVV
jgi:hypothetical protein